MLLTILLDAATNAAAPANPENFYGVLIAIVTALGSGMWIYMTKRNEKMSELRKVNQTNSHELSKDILDHVQGQSDSFQQDIVVRFFNQYVEQNKFINNRIANDLSKLSDTHDELVTALNQVQVQLDLVNRRLGALDNETLKKITHILAKIDSIEIKINNK